MLSVGFWNEWTEYLNILEELLLGMRKVQARMNLELMIFEWIEVVEM